MSGLKNVITLAVAALAGACTRPAEACSLLPTVVNASSDATAALKDCIDKLTAGDRLELNPGTYRLRRPLVITRRVSISTAGLGPGSPGCAELPAARCATLLIDPQEARDSNIMPVLVAANGVSLSHLIIRGVGATPRQRSFCGLPSRRPLGGGVRVSGSDFVLRKSVLRDFACYTAVEVTAGASAPTIEDNVIGPNGDHRPGEVWADGVTIHDSEAAAVRGNLFIDNTDVQLILGGCRACRIENNRFRHSGPFSKASFAALMLHSWPSTSGDYTGTLVRGNQIDCGQLRRCGYGIMIGSAPWYQGRMTGGRIYRKFRSKRTDCSQHRRPQRTGGNMGQQGAASRRPVSI